MSVKITTLIKTSLCYQCGTCAVVCKQDCIEMHYDTRKGMILPDVDGSKCNNCGLCEKVCPILNIDGPKDQFESISTGIFHAADATLFETSSSGGATGAILQYLFQNNIIDCAVVTGIVGIYAQPRIIRSADEISQIQGSKYQPVALNTILRDIRKGERFAVVGLPCHIDGLMRLTNYDELLRKGLALTIGIYCTIGRSLFATLAALSNVKEPKGDLNYRYGNYPGNFGFIENQNFVQISSFQKHLEQYDYFFYPCGCHYCDNLYNVNADICVGDTWGLGCGKSAIVMTRTITGEEVVRDAVLKGGLCQIRSASREENRSTQEHSYNYKILNYYSRMKTLSLLPGSMSIPVSSGNARYLFPYLFLYLFTLLFNNHFGYVVVCNDFCRKILLKVRNRLLRYVV